MLVYFASRESLFVRFIKILVSVLLSVLAAFLGGFLLFLILLSSYPTSPLSLKAIPETDALVILTGAPGRITEGMRLLHHKKGKALFISGVSPKVARKDLLSLQKISPSLAHEQVILGHQASNTHENALEVTHWIDSYSKTHPTTPIKSIYVITSFYHLPRCLLELKAVLKDVTIVPYGVGPNESVWYLLIRDSYYRKRILQEYLKCLAVCGHLGIQYVRG